MHANTTYARVFARSSKYCRVCRFTLAVFVSLPFVAFRSAFWVYWLSKTNKGRCQKALLLFNSIIPRLEQARRTILTSPWRTILCTETWRRVGKKSQYETKQPVYSAVFDIIQSNPHVFMGFLCVYSFSLSLTLPQPLTLLRFCSRSLLYVDTR